MCEDAEARGSAFESSGEYSGTFKKSMSQDDVSQDDAQDDACLKTMQIVSEVQHHVKL